MFGHKQTIGDGLVHPINNKIESYNTGAATAHICQIIILNPKIEYLKTFQNILQFHSHQLFLQ